MDVTDIANPADTASPADTTPADTHMAPQFRPVWAEVDLDAVRHNVRNLMAMALPAALLAVVKADGYGHGAVPVARAALEAGASWLGVALVEEGIALRNAGIEAPVLVLSEQPATAAAAIVAHHLTPIVYTAHGIDALAKAVASAGGSEPLSVHLKVDTGMHRVGCAPDEALALAEAVAARAELVLGGVCTHFAVADDPTHPSTRQQIRAFETLLDALAERDIRPALVHASNSAGLLAHPGARYDLVRCGIAIYGIPPGPAVGDIVALRPALSLKARVSFVKELPAGSRLSYGLRYELGRAGRVATIPIGYADGVARNLGLAGGQVLIRGRRFPIAGTVTMDQLMVDLGVDADDKVGKEKGAKEKLGTGNQVEVGDEVVLLGRQGGEEITAEEWAARLGTIAYEIPTGISGRVPRHYLAERSTP